MRTVDVDHPDLVVPVDAMPRVPIRDPPAIRREARVELRPRGRGQPTKAGAVGRREENVAVLRTGERECPGGRRRCAAGATEPQRRASGDQPAGQRQGQDSLRGHDLASGDCLADGMAWAYADRVVTRQTPMAVARVLRVAERGTSMIVGTPTC